MLSTGQVQTPSFQSRGGRRQRSGPVQGDGVGPAEEGGQQEPRCQPQPQKHGRPQAEQGHDPVLRPVSVKASRCQVSGRGATQRSSARQLMEMMHIKAQGDVNFLQNYYNFFFFLFF